MRKLAFIVDMKKCYGNDTLKKWVLFAQQQGIDGIELLFNAQDKYEFDADFINKAFEGSGVEVAACGFWRLNTLDPDPTVRATNRDITFKFLEMVKNIGCKNAFFNVGEAEKDNDEKNLSEFQKEYPQYKKYAEELGLSLSNYLGHPGNFINSRELLKKVVDTVPGFRIKLDPVGVMRNMKDDPYDILRMYGDKVVHFHVKDIFRYNDGFEIEPAIGMGDLKWNVIFGMLYHFNYEGYVVIEPHGPKWGSEEFMWKGIVLAKRHVEQFMLR